MPSVTWLFALHGAMTGAVAADYPARPVRMIVPQGAGSSSDNLVRLLAVKLGEALRQQIVVDNRAGASGMIGMEIAVNAAPDGYTLLATSTGIHVVVPQLRRKLPFHPLRDLAPVAQFASTHNALAVQPAVAATTLPAFVALARAAPGKFNMASAGNGTQSHLAGLQFIMRAGIDAVHVPYKGGGAMVGALLANEAQFTVTPLPGVLPHAQAGRLRVLGTGGARRAVSLPDTPTFAEAGLPGFQSGGWSGLLLPLRTPRALVERLHASLSNVMGQPQLRERFAQQGAEVVVSSPGEFGAFMREEWARYAQVIRAAKLTSQ